MQEIDYVVKKDLEPYVNCVMVDHSSDLGSHTNIPLYADGYPGIMFQEAQNGFYLLPREKKLSQLFLYGQTLDPVSLDVKGPYRFVVVQLYPFASKYLLGVNPKELNDDCFDLLKLQNVDTTVFHRALVNCQKPEEQVSIISDLMLALIKANKVSSDDRIQSAIELILENQGQVLIKDLLEQLNITERTFERNFVGQVGLTPKQFAKIVQFQCSLHQLTQSKFDKLVEIGMDSGFSDQSHFIRTFRRYTGQTPSFYLQQMSA